MKTNYNHPGNRKPAGAKKSSLSILQDGLLDSICDWAIEAYQGRSNREPSIVKVKYESNGVVSSAGLPDYKCRTIAHAVRAGAAIISVMLEKNQFDKEKVNIHNGRFRMALEDDIFIILQLKMK